MTGQAPEHDSKTNTRVGDRGPAVVESALRAAIYERLGEARFGLWFGDGVRLNLSGDGDVLEVHVPDTFFREWIQSHYTTSLIEAAEAVVGRPLRVLIQLSDQTEIPSANVIESVTGRIVPDSATKFGRTTIPPRGHSCGSSLSPLNDFNCS